MTEPQLSSMLRSFARNDPGDWTPLLEQAEALDQAGVDRLVLSDHVVFGERLGEYGRPEIGGQAGGRQPTGPDGHWLEPLSTLAVVAGRTGRIRLGTNILIAALRRPVVLAKSAATIDVLSGGRLDLGVGVGWQREEYEAAGLSFDRRGELLDEALRICQLLWREQVAAYDTPGLRFDRIHMMPKPRQTDGVPIWVSGTVNRRVARRLAEFGSGWIPWGAAAADTVQGIRQMGDLLAELDKDIASMQVVGSLPISAVDGRIDVPATMAPVGTLLEAGVSDFRMNLRLPTDRSKAVDLLVPLVQAFRTAVGQPG
jgi:probable F420-dependent oxidoreductase